MNKTFILTILLLIPVAGYAQIQPREILSNPTIQGGSNTVFQITVSIGVLPAQSVYATDTVRASNTIEAATFIDQLGYDSWDWTRVFKWYIDSASQVLSTASTIADTSLAVQYVQQSESIPNASLVLVLDGKIANATLWNRAHNWYIESGSDLPLALQAHNATMTAQQEADLDWIVANLPTDVTLALRAHDATMTVQQKTDLGVARVHVDQTTTAHGIPIGDLLYTSDTIAYASTSGVAAAVHDHATDEYLTTANGVQQNGSATLTDVSAENISFTGFLNGDGSGLTGITSELSGSQATDLGIARAHVDQTTTAHGKDLNDLIVASLSTQNLNATNTVITPSLLGTTINAQNLNATDEVTFASSVGINTTADDAWLDINATGRLINLDSVSGVTRATVTSLFRIFDEQDTTDASIWSSVMVIQGANSAGQTAPLLSLFNYANSPQTGLYVEHQSSGPAIDINKTGAGDALLIRGGKSGFGTMSPVNMIDVEGAVAIGSSYSGSSTAPTNGMAVEGNIRSGTTEENAQLTVGGTGIWTSDITTNDASLAEAVINRATIGDVQFLGRTYFEAVNSTIGSSTSIYLNLGPKQIITASATPTITLTGMPPGVMDGWLKVTGSDVGITVSPGTVYFATNAYDPTDNHRFYSYVWDGYNNELSVSSLEF